MHPCVPHVPCGPPTPGWSAVILTAITLYGVLEILSVFTAIVHWQQPSRGGAHVLRILAMLDLVSAALAPVFIYWILGAPRIAAAVMAVQLGLAAACRSLSRRGAPHEPPPARAFRRG